MTREDAIAYTVDLLRPAIDAYRVAVADARASGATAEEIEAGLAELEQRYLAAPEADAEVIKAMMREFRAAGAAFHEAPIGRQ